MKQTQRKEVTSMKRTDLIKMTNALYANTSTLCRGVEKVTNKALLFKYDNAVILQSYNTLVAIYSDRTATLYVFDKYSNTIYRHIYKAAKMLGAMRITWLYERYDGVIETALSEHAITYKPQDKLVKNIIVKHDYDTCIQNKWN